jgi:hypothetical protein
MPSYPVKVARIPFPSRNSTQLQTSSSASPLLDPFQLDPNPKAIIQAAEDFTISINTISSSLYSNYKSTYLAGQHNNNYFVLLSCIGIGDQSKPTTKLNFLQPINDMTRDYTDIWAENVAIVDDYLKADDAQRIYISFQAFCQDLGTTKYADIKTAGDRILGLTGSIFPNLMPFTSIGQAVVSGVQNIFAKLSQNPGQCKKVEFNLYPVVDSTETIRGEAPLQTGSYVLFFEDTIIDGLQLDSSGIVRGNSSTKIPPYIIVNVKKGKRLAPRFLDVNAATEILARHQKNYSYLLPGSGSPTPDRSEGFLDALQEFGKSQRLVQSMQRYYQLKDKPDRTIAETTKFKELATLLKTNFSDQDWA